MAGRHTSRQRALQILYQWDMRGGAVDDAIEAFYDSLFDHAEAGEAPTPQPARDRFMEELVRGTAANVESIDQKIGEKSVNWRIERMPVVDRNVLRLGIYEMTGAKAPPAVVIDEALELARQFSGEESVSFINGVLDAVRRDVPAQPG